MPPTPPRPRWFASSQGAAVGLWAGALAWCALVWRAGSPQGDFANYWTAAALWWEGADLSRLYEYRWFTEQASRLGFADQLVGFPVLTPPSALLVAPLLVFGPASGAALWRLVALGAGIGLALYVARAANRPPWVGFAALLLLTPPLRSHLEQGQAHLPAALALGVALHLWLRGRAVGAGLLLGLAIGLKVHAWPLLLLALLTRSWRLAGAAVATLVVGGLVSVALLGWPVHAVFLREIAPAATAGMFVDPWHPAYQGLGQAARQLWAGNPHLAAPATSPFLAAFVPTLLAWAAIAATAAGARRDLDDTARRRLLAAGAMVALAFGPILSRYHLVMLVPPLLIGADALWREGRRPRALVFVACLALAGWVDPPMAWGEGALRIAAGIPRFWLLALAWLLVVPRPRPMRLVPLIAVALVLSGVAGRAAVRAHQSLWADGAVAVGGVAPLVAADLVLGEGGSLALAGLVSDRQGRPGRGWVGMLFAPESGLPPGLDAFDANAHVWAPVALPDGAFAWSRGPLGTGAVLGARGAGPAGGRLWVVPGASGTDVEVRWADGRVRRLTNHPGQDQDPVWDAVRGRVWFLSDRGVGVRALRLWWVAI